MLRVTVRVVWVVAGNRVVRACGYRHAVVCARGRGGAAARVGWCRAAQRSKGYVRPTAAVCCVCMRNASLGRYGVGGTAVMAAARCPVVVAGGVVNAPGQRRAKVKARTRER